MATISLIQLQTLGARKVTPHLASVSMQKNKTGEGTDVSSVQELNSVALPESRNLVTFPALTLGSSQVSVALRHIPKKIYTHTKIKST